MVTRSENMRPDYAFKLATCCWANDLIDVRLEAKKARRLCRSRMPPSFHARPKPTMLRVKNSVFNSEDEERVYVALALPCETVLAYD
jgi:hypothetical protein